MFVCLFLFSTRIYCCINAFIYPQVVSGPWTPNDTVLKFPGAMTDLVLADCYLPESPVTPGYFHEIDEGTPAAGLMISVSNDGEHESIKNLTFISYDPACMSCNISSGCSLKASDSEKFMYGIVLIDSFASLVDIFSDFCFS